jgi:hypothetical protein
MLPIQFRKFSMIRKGFFHSNVTKLLPLIVSGNVFECPYNQLQIPLDPIKNKEPKKKVKEVMFQYN